MDPFRWQGPCLLQISSTLSPSPHFHALFNVYIEKKRFFMIPKLSLLVALEAEVMITHYGDVIMDATSSQITGVSSVYSTVCSGADQRKHQSSASLAFLRVTDEFPAHCRASNAENVSIWWRHYATVPSVTANLTSWRLSVFNAHRDLCAYVTFVSKANIYGPHVISHNTLKNSWTRDVDGRTLKIDENNNWYILWSSNPLARFFFTWFERLRHVVRWNHRFFLLRVFTD